MRERQKSSPQIDILSRCIRRTRTLLLRQRVFPVHQEEVELDMKRKLLFFSVALFFCLGWSGCNDKDTETFTNYRIGDVRGAFLGLPYEGVEESDLPEWLISKLKSTERLAELRIEVYQFDWRDRSWYYIHNPLNSCMYCEVYDLEGIPIRDIIQDEEYHFLETSINWRFIYYI